MTKCCTRCGAVKPLDQFGKSARQPDGYSRECKGCLADDASRRYRRRREAAGHTYKRDSLDYFLERIDTTGDCWVWTGYAAGRPGYGRVYYQGTMILAHRLSYLLHHGDLPDGAFICHHCDNPRCVNPAHLYAGDIASNSRDAVERGRYVPKPGEANPAARLTTAQVQDIRSRWRSGEQQAFLAREYGISKSQTNRIVHGTTWRHLDLSGRRAG